MSRSLVLNATYEPLGVVTERRALLLVLNSRATMVESSGTILHFAQGQIELPSVIRLNKFVRFHIVTQFLFHVAPSLRAMVDVVFIARHQQLQLIT